MKFTKIISLGMILFFGACAEQKTEFPSKNITMIVPFAAGGGTDSVARVLGKALEKQLNTSIVIENRTGGSGALGMTTGAKSKNDGYTITMITRELVTLPLLNLASISGEDFDTIALVNYDPAVLLVNSSSPYQTFQDFLNVVKAKPNGIPFASTAKPNFYLGALEKELGIQLKQIPFNGAGEAIPAVLGNHAEATIVGPGEALSQVLSGQMRALAVLNDERIASYQDIPTLKELGINISTGTWRGIAVPKGTSKEVKDKLSKAVEQVMKDSEFTTFMNDRAFGILYKDSENFSKFIQEDNNSLAEVVTYIQENNR